MSHLGPVKLVKCINAFEGFRGAALVVLLLASSAGVANSIQLQAALKTATAPSYVPAPMNISKATDSWPGFHTALALAESFVGSHASAKSSALGILAQGFAAAPNPAQGLGGAGNGLDGALGGSTEESDLSLSTMMGIAANTKGDLWILVSAVIFNSIMVLAFTTVFCILLKLYPAVYKRAPKEEDHHECAPPAGICNKFSFYTEWFSAVKEISNDKIMEFAGLDGLMFIEYHRLMMMLLLVLSPVILVILCPMHYHYGMNTPEIDILSRIGINNLPHGSPCFWIHAAFVWYVCIATVLLIAYFQYKFVKERYKFLGLQPLPIATTVMIENLPKIYRSDKKLHAFFEQVFGKGSVERAYVVRRAGMIYQMQRHMQTLQSKLQTLKLQGLTGSGGDAADGADAEEGRAAGDDEHKKLEGEIEEAKAQMAKEAQRINDATQVQEEAPEQEQAKGLASVFKDVTGMASNVTGMALAAASGEALDHEDIASDEHEMFSSAAFVTFTSRKWRRMALREQFSEYSDRFVVTHAPEPTDVCYDSLSVDRKDRNNLEFFGRTAMIGIIVAWLPLVLSVSAFTSLRSLQDKSPYIRTLCEDYPTVESVLEGVLSTLGLTILMGLLPTVFLFIFREFFNNPSGATVQFHMQHWLYSFNIFFVVLVTAVSRSLLNTAKVVAASPAELFAKLALSMPSASHFYLQFVVLGWSNVVLEQLRTSNLGKYIAFRLFYEPAVAKEKSEPESECTYGMGSRFAKVSTFSAILLCFCTCSPLICLLCLVYYRLGAMTYTYLLCFAETKKPDLGGGCWVQALNQLFTGLSIFVGLMVGILELRAETANPGIVAGGAYAVVWLGWRRLNSFNWQERTLMEELKEDMKEQATPASKAARCGEYVQPQLEIEAES